MLRAVSYVPGSVASQNTGLPYVPNVATDPYTPLNSRIAVDSNAGAFTLVAGRRYYIPAKLDYAMSLTAAGVVATAVTTTGNVRLSVFAWGVDGLPAALLSEFTSAAQIGINTAAGTKTVTLPTSFAKPSDFVYLMVQADAAVQLLQATPYSSMGIGMTGNRDGMYFYKDATYGAAPITGDNTGLTMVTRSSGGQILVVGR